MKKFVRLGRKHHRLWSCTALAMAGRGGHGLRILDALELGKPDEEEA